LAANFSQLASSATAAFKLLSLRDTATATASASLSLASGEPGEEIRRRLDVRQTSTPPADYRSCSSTSSCNALINVSKLTPALFKELKAGDSLPHGHHGRRPWRWDAGHTAIAYLRPTIRRVY